jgi:PKD-like domain/PKD domain/Secretion system C-terminal sorting domain
MYKNSCNSLNNLFVMSKNIGYHGFLIKSILLIFCMVVTIEDGMALDFGKILRKYFDPTRFKDVPVATAFAGPVIVTGPTVNTGLCDGGGFINLGDIVVSESANSDFSMGTNVSLFLDAPAGFKFKPNIGLATATGSDLVVLSTIVNSRYIYVQLNVNGTANLNTLTIQGVQVASTTGGTNQYIKLNAGISTAVIAGLDGNTVFATLSSNPSPSAAGAISGTATVCQGQNNVNYTVPAISGADTNGYIWSLPNGASITSGAGTNSITVAFDKTSSSGNITVKGSNANCGNGAGSLPFLVTVNPLPADAGSISGPTYVVTGNTVQYSVSPINNADTYNWYFDPVNPPATIEATINPNIKNITFSTDGPYTLNVKGNNGCGDGNLNVLNIAVGIIPTKSVNTSYCEDFPGSITIVPNVGINPDQLPGPAADEDYIYDGTGITPTISTYPYTPTTFYFTPSTASLGSNTFTAKRIKKADGTVVATYTQVVTMYSTPNSLSISGITNGQSFCKNSSPINITGTQTGGTGAGKFEIYQNSIVPGNLINALTTTGSTFNLDPNSSSYNPVSTGTNYFVVYTYTNAAGGCSASTSTTITMYPAPTSLNITGVSDGQTFCKNDAAVTISGTQISGAGSAKFKVYRNSISPANIINALTTNGSTFILDPASPSYNASNNYVLVYTYTNTTGGCADSTTKTITLKSFPTNLTISGIVDNQDFCKDATAVLIKGTQSGGSGNGTFEIYQNSIAPANLVNYENGSTFNFDPTSAIYTVGNNYLVLYTYTIEGCSASLSKTITVKPAAVSSHSGLAASYCSNQANVLIQGLNTGLSVTSGSFIISDTLGGPPIIDPSNLKFQDNGDGTATFKPQGYSSITSPATQWVRFTYTNPQGCSNTYNYQVIIYPSPSGLTISGITDGQTFCTNNASVTVIGSPSDGPSGSGIFKIYKNLISPDSLVSLLTTPGSSFILNPKSSNYIAGNNYVLLYTYTNTFGCSDTTSKTIKINQAPTNLNITGITDGQQFCKNIAPITITGTQNNGSGSGNFKVYQNSISAANLISALTTAGSTFTFDPTSSNYNAGNNFVVVYKYTNTVGGCADSTFKTITVKPTPTNLTINGVTNGQDFCKNASAVTLTGSPGSGSGGTGKFEIYQNAINPPNLIGALTTTGSSFNFDPKSSYYVAGNNYVVLYTYTNTVGGCSDTTSRTVKINPAPTSLTISGITDGQQFCSDAASVTLTGNQIGVPGSGKFELYQNTTLLATAPVSSITVDLSLYGTSSGNYTVKYIYTNSAPVGSCSESISKSVTINPAPTNLAINGITNGQAFCKDASAVTITGTQSNGFGSGSFKIYRNSISPDSLISALNTSGSSFTLNPQASTYAAGNNYVVVYTYTNTAGGCSASTSTTVTINPIPANLTISGIADGQQFCTNSATVTITGSQTGVPGSGTFEIYRSSTLVTSSAGSSITFNPALNAVGNYTVKYTYTNSAAVGSCAVSTSKTIAVNPAPTNLTINGITSGQAFCKDASAVTITGTQSNGFGSGSFKIYKNSISPDSLISALNTSGSSFTLNPQASTYAAGNNYVVVYTYTNTTGGCSDTTSKTLKINPIPSNLTITGIIEGQKFCTNSPAVTINGSQNGVAGSGTFGIYQNGTLVTSSAGSSITFNPGLFAVGNYTVQYSYTNSSTVGACSASTSRSITINPVPTNLTINGITSGQAFCKDASAITITGTQSNGFGSGTFEIYQNSISTANLVSSVDGSSINFDPTSSIYPAGNNYIVVYTYTNTAGGCSASTSATLTLNANPSALAINGVTDNQGICSNSSAIQITVSPSDFVSGSGKVEIYQNSVSSANLVATYTDASTFSIDPASSIYAAGSTYVVKYTYTTAASGCSAFITKDVKINAAPNLKFDLNTNYCVSDPNVTLQGKDGTSTVLSGTYQIADALSGSYTTDVSKLVDNGNGTASFIPAGFTGITTTTDKWIRLSYTNGNGCTQTYIQKVTINPAPVPTFNGLGNSAYCNDRTLNIDLTGFNNGSTLNTTIAGQNGTGSFEISSDGGSSYAANPAALPNIGAGKATFLPGALPTGTYYIRFAVTNNGCTGYSSPQAVTINAIPTGISFSNSFDCSTLQVTFNLTGTDLSQSLYFDYGDGGKDSSLAGDPNRKTTLVRKYTTNLLNYTVKFKAVNPTGCAYTFSKDVTVGVKPNTDFTAFGSCQGSATQFTDKTTISNGDVIKSWYWDFGDGNTSTSQSPNYTYTSPGAYTVKLKVTGSICDSTKSQTIAILPNVTVTPTAQYRERFDSNSGGWIAGGTNSSWAWGTPNKVLISNASSNGKVWTTGIGSTYNDNEASVVQSPCFTISSVTRAVLGLRYFSATQKNIDGASIFYTLDDGVNWKLLGKPNTGQNWYNATGVTYSLDASSKAAWTGKNAGWKLAKYSLDDVLADSKYSGKVRFRVGFGSSSSHSSADSLDGFAFDEVILAERNRITLIEYFNNANNSNASSDASFLNNFKTEDQSIDIRYHMTDPAPIGSDAFNQANTADPSARALLYGVSNSPSTLVDGIYTQSGSFSNWGSDVFNSRTLEQAPFKISLQFNSNKDSIVDVTATVQALAQIDEKTLVQIVVVQRSATLNGTTYKNVVRKMLPDAAGTKVDKNTWKQGTIKTFNQTWLPSTVSDVSKLAVVVFVQSDSTKEVFQSAIADPASGIIKQPKLVTALDDSNQAAGFAEELILYPNPAQDVLNIQFDTQRFSNGEWSIYDNSGLMLSTGGFVEAQNGILKINTSDYASGMYFLNMKDKKRNTMHRQFVISR